MSVRDELRWPASETSSTGSKWQPSITSGVSVRSPYSICLWGGTLGYPTIGAWEQPLWVVPFDDSMLFVTSPRFSEWLPVGRVSAAQESRKALTEIRQLSGLTWGQLAYALGVDRRSLHLWARGARLSAENAERLERLRAIVRHLDAGHPDDTRQRLLTAIIGSDSVLDLLAQRRDDEVLGWLRGSDTRRPRRRRTPPALAPSERAARRGFSPIELLDARHDEPRRESAYRGAVPIPSFEETSA